MAMIKCAECGKEFSSNARVCPHCGNPLQNYPQDKAMLKGLRGCRLVGLIICGLFILFMLFLFSLKFVR